jgi:hypothetical protein
MSHLAAMITAAVLALGIAPQALAICKWTDANGRVQYANKPPQGVRCESTISASPPQSSSSASPSAPRSFQEEEMEFRKRRLERGEAEKKAEKAREETEARKKACDEARSRAAGLAAGGRMARYDANGERRFLTDEEIASEITNARKQADMLCK